MNILFILFVTWQLMGNNHFLIWGGLRFSGARKKISEPSSVKILFSHEKESKTIFSYHVEQKYIFPSVVGFILLKFSSTIFVFSYNAKSKFCFGQLGH
jgi:hypothetical protein